MSMGGGEGVVPPKTTNTGCPALAGIATSDAFRGRSMQKGGKESRCVTDPGCFGTVVLGKGEVSCSINVSIAQKTKEKTG